MVLRSLSLGTYFAGPSDIMAKILIVDDQPEICELLSTLFSSNTMVKTSRSLEEAVLALSQHNFDLVISDLSLKGRNGTEGFELLSHIRSKSPSTEVIIMTGSGTDEIKKNAIRLGAAHFFEKPIDTRSLLSQVNTILGGNHNGG